MSTHCAICKSSSEHRNGHWADRVGPYLVLGGESPNTGKTGHWGQCRQGVEGPYIHKASLWVSYGRGKRSKRRLKVGSNACRRTIGWCCGCWREGWGSSCPRPDREGPAVRDQLSGTKCQGPTVREQTQPECAFVQKGLLGETGLFVTVELRWSDGEWIACCGRHQPSRSSSFSSCSCP